MSDDKKGKINAYDEVSRLISDSTKPFNIANSALGSLHAKLSPQLGFFDKISSNPIFNDAFISKSIGINDTYRNITELANPIKGAFSTTADILARQQSWMNIGKANSIMEMLSGANSIGAILADKNRYQNTIKIPTLDIQSFSAVGATYKHLESLGAFNKNPLQDILKGVASLTSYHNTAAKIEHLYNPVNVLAGLPKYYEASKNFQDIFPKGIIDFSKNDILKEAFNNINSSFNNALSDADIELDDDLSIADNLNIALNIDYQESGLTDSDMPILVFEKILSQINEIITDGKEWTIEKYKKLQAFFKTPLGAATLVVLGFYINNAYGPKIAEWNNKLFGWEQTTPSHTPIMQCITTNNKVLKLESNWDSETIGTIPNSESLNILDISDDKKWIKISFISQGTFTEGWTDNTDIVNK